MLQHLFEGSALKKSITLYIITILGILFLQPSFLFDEESNMRCFGLGDKKTIVPLPVLFIILAILIYLVCLFV